MNALFEGTYENLGFYASLFYVEAVGRDSRRICGPRTPIRRHYSVRQHRPFPFIPNVVRGMIDSEI